VSHRIQGVFFLVVDIRLMIEVVSHGGVDFGGVQVGVLATHLIRRPAVSQIVHRNLSDANARQPLQVRRAIGCLLDVRIRDVDAHSNFPLLLSIIVFICRPTSKERRTTEPVSQLSRGPSSVALPGEADFSAAILHPVVPSRKRRRQFVYYSVLLWSACTTVFGLFSSRFASVGKA
jgi:hypothetical protein